MGWIFEARRHAFSRRPLPRPQVDIVDPQHPSARPSPSTTGSAEMCDRGRSINSGACPGLASGTRVAGLRLRPRYVGCKADRKEIEARGATVFLRFAGG